MKIERKAAFAPRTSALALDLASLQAPCVGCDGCTGLCDALIDALTLPDLLLGKGRKA